jgi:hypothetical protein
MLYLQRSAAPPLKALAHGEAEHASVSIDAESPIIQPINAGLHGAQTLSGGTIAVSVIGCADLPVWDQPGTSCNPYCILQLGDHKKTTQLKYNMRDPYFGEVFAFPFSPGANEAMTVTVKHREEAGDQMLGWVSIPITVIEDYVRQSKMERALSGLSFLRPSSPKSPDANELEGIASPSNRFEALGISRCSEVSEHELHKKYPGMKRLSLEGAAGKMGADGQFIERPGLYLRFEIEKENTENLEAQDTSSIPVFGQKQGQIAVTLTPEAPICLSLSFAEDIVPFALDSTLVSEWTFSLHRDLSMLTGEHQSRFDMVSADIKDIMTVNLVVRPPYMLENAHSTKPAREVVDDLKAMVLNTKSKLRSVMPSLFQMTQEGDDQESNSDNQSDSSTMGSDDDETRDEDDMGSVVSLDQDQLIFDEDEIIDIHAYVKEISDEKSDETNPQQFTASAPRTVRAAAPPPSPPVRAAVPPPLQDAKQTSSKMPMNSHKVSAHIHQIKTTIIPANMPRLEGAELYSVARRSLG